MKVKCIAPDHGYEHSLTTGNYYEILDIQDGIFAGDYYVIIDAKDSDNGKSVTCHHYRFDITKEQCNEYVMKHHLDWRKAAKFPSQQFQQ